VRILRGDVGRKHFVQLLTFINNHFNCGGPPPLPAELTIENVPKMLVRMARGPNWDSDYYISDPVVGSVFVYDSTLTLKAELKALDRPLGVAVDSKGFLLVGNDGRDNVEVYDPATGELVTVIGEGTIRMPTAITVDELGNIYVTDAKGDTVRVFSPDYVALRTIGQRGPGEGGLRFPVDTVIVKMSEVFVADQGNDRIQIYTLDGVWLRSLTFEGTDGENCHWFTNVCEIPGAPPFNRLKAMDMDSLGRLHVLDNLHATVLVFEPSSGSFDSAYGTYGTGQGTLYVPMDVILTPLDEGMVTSGDSDRIELYSVSEL
jgi:DNA-binding beta-propeller fold protein YncE